MGGLLLEFFLGLLEFFLGLGGGGGSLGELLLLELVHGVCHLLTGLVQLLPGLGHALGVLGLFGAFLHLVEVTKELFLFVLETLELIGQLVLFLFGLGVGELLLELTHFFCKGLLPPGQFLQPIQYGEALRLLSGLLFFGFLFLLVALLLLLQFQGVDLLLLGIVGGWFAFGVGIGPGDVVL